MPYYKSDFRQKLELISNHKYDVIIFLYYKYICNNGKQGVFISKMISMVQDQIKGLRSFGDGEVARFHDVLQPQGFFEVDGQRFSSRSHEDVRLLTVCTSILGLPASASSFRLNNNHFRLRPWRTAREFLPRSM